MDIFWGHRKTGLFLGSFIYIEGLFLKVKGTEFEYVLLNFQILFWVNLIDIPDMFFGKQ